MTAPVVESTHPVLSFVATAAARLREAAARPAWSLSEAEQRAALVGFAQLRSMLDAAQLAILAEADRSGATTGQGDGSAADWVAGQTRQTRRSARADLRLARRVETLPVLEEAMRAGWVSLEQARAIVTALDRLPASGEFAVSAEQHTQAEEFLVEKATDHDAEDLRRLGLRLFEVIAPDAADANEGRILQAQEARALRKTSFSMWQDEHGICHGRFAVPHLQGQILEKALFAMGAEEDSEEPVEVRRGLAFGRILESLKPQQLSTTGGVGATIVVTMTLEQLLSGLGACGLDTGGAISASEARRLACTAGIIPAVLGGQSQLLDLGRRRRFHTPAQRLAMGIRDKGCTATGCDKPPAMCHAHHDTPWSLGGGTNIADGRLLCGHHHRRIHDPAYHHTLRPDGTVEFHRRE